MYTNILTLLFAAGICSATTLQITSFEATSDSLALRMQVIAGNLFGNFYPGDLASMPSWPYIPGQAIKALEWWDGTAQVTVGGQSYQGLGSGYTQITGILPDTLTGGLDSFPIEWSMDVFFSSSLLSPPLFEIKGSGSGVGILDEKAYKFTYVSTPEPGSFSMLLVGAILVSARRKKFPRVPGKSTGS